MPSGRSHVHAEESYLAWKNYYVTTSGACGYRRVLFNDMSSTYSEGIAYGMLLSVNYNDRELFDDLWRYYMAHMDPRGMMHWHIGSNCGQIVGDGGATDADEDAAFALILAHRQWGSNGSINYLQHAITQINRIYQWEVEPGTYVLKPGDYWGGSNVTNPSYFAPAYYRVFRAVTGNAGWDSVITRCYDILQRAAHVTTGLVPDWCRADGQPAPGFAYYYYYDATRTPWRIAMDYLWFGEPRALDFCRKISNFVRAIGSVNVGEGYQLNGTPMGSAHLNVFVGPFASASMATTPSYQAFCDSAYDDNVQTVPPYPPGNYYNRSLRTLTLFLQTGNFFNPLDSTVRSAPQTPVLVAPPDSAFGLAPSVAFVWRVSPTAVRYTLQLALDSSFTTLAFEDTLVVDTTRTVSGLQPLTRYYWRVRAMNNAGASAFSQPWSFRIIGFPTQVALLSPPQSATNQPTSIVFVWRAAQDRFEGPSSILRYWFEMSTDTSSSPIVQDTTLTDTTRTVGGLSHLTTYYWRARARNEAGWGEFSSWWHFTTVAGPPSAPVLLSPPNASTGHDTVVALRWQQQPLAAFYHVQAAADTSFVIPVLDDSTLTDTVRTLVSLQRGTWYYWRVRARNQSGPGSWSQTWSFRTLPRLPAPVTLLSPPNNAILSADTVRFLWMHAEPEIQHYWFELASDSVFLNSIVDSTIVDTLTIRSLSGGGVFWWRVRAYNAAGWGPFSTVWVVRRLQTSQGQPPDIPEKFSLEQNHPNPFNPSTVIRYGVPGRSHIRLVIYDQLGREVARLVDDVKESGYYDVRFDGRNLASGMYFCRLMAFPVQRGSDQVSGGSSPSFVATRKLVLMK
ncbi:MAG TPA: glycosyl hydrolase family 8 [Bacteroidota bacterium]|nr:glycosyl hydrolase family 8 [Bacteroidota bacterium]